MNNETLPDRYAMLTTESVIEYLRNIDAVVAILGEPRASWTTSEIGDGNLNFVFHVQSEQASVIVKQALPWLRARGENWPLPLSRAYFEYEALVREEQRAPGLTPGLIHFDGDMALTVMEHLSPHIILRKGLVQGIRYPTLARDLGRFLARTLFRGSDLSLDASVKRADMALFAGNDALCAVTEARVFTEPYYDAELNRWTSPQLDDLVAEIRADSMHKAGIHAMKTIFMTKAQSLLHGDLHSGSVMVTEDDTRVIDPEFAFYGPMGFDIGALLANYLIAYLAQPDQAAQDNDRTDYAEWILSTAFETWTEFEEEFKYLWQTERTGTLFPLEVFGNADEVATNRARSDFLADIFRDTVGFAAAKMMRRVIGAAHVEDLESITDSDRRASREKQVIALSRELLRRRADIATMEDVIAAARKHQVAE